MGLLATTVRSVRGSVAKLQHVDALSNLALQLAFRGANVEQGCLRCDLLLIVYPNLSYLTVFGDDFCLPWRTRGAMR